MSKVKAPLATDSSKGTRSEFAYSQQVMPSSDAQKVSDRDRTQENGMLILYLHNCA